MSVSPEPSPTEPVRHHHWLHLATWTRRSKVATGILGAVLAGGVAFAATTWTVGLATNSSGGAQAGGVGNISIVAVTSPAPGNLLFPGATGDVVARISNPNAFPVTITALSLPASTSFAAGYGDAGLSSALTGCTSLLSTVGYVGATLVSGSSHTLTSPITVAANGNQTITFTNEATMGLLAPAACENAYLSMPSFTGVTASAGSATATTFTTDTWS